MKQSINFLKELPQNSDRLSAAIMGLVLVAAVAVLIIISVLLSLINYQAYKSLKLAQTQMLRVQEEDDKLAKAYPLLVGDIPFVTRVKTLEEELQTKKEELHSLQHLIIRRGFSEYMLALAQSTPNTLWLNQIEINHDSSSITLNGYVVRPDAVSTLMSQLLTTNAFKNVIFNLFFVKKIKNHPYLKFSIATHDLGPQEDSPIDQVPKNAQGVK